MITLKIIFTSRLLILILFFSLSSSVLANSSVISLELNHVDLRSTLQLLAERGNLNLIMADEVQGKISLHLSHMRWEEAFNVVLKTKGLVQRRIGQTIWVSTLSEMMQQDKQAWQAQQQANDFVPLLTHAIKIHYAKATDIATILKEKNNGVLSEHGRALADDRIHLIWLNDTAMRIKMAKNLINQLDVPLKQIMIEARIVNVDRSFEKALGLHFGLSNVPPSHNKENKKDNDSKPPPELLPLTVATKGGSPLGMFVAQLGQGILLDLELAALENEGKGEFISNPKLLTQDQKTATIQAGEEIPFQEKTRGGGSNITFKKAVLSLEVTPRVLPHKQLLLDLKVNQDAPGVRISEGVPMIDTRQIETHVQVGSGQTFVLGGILEESKHKNVDKIPFLSQIPLMGRLFQSHDKRDEQRELLIFITPTIVN
jgi:type IV pilus assembly protein PilQ